MFYIYRIYYNNQIVYIGRTNNIDNRIRQHILSGKSVQADKISKIEFAKLDTEADMNLYELYYILKYKPILNIKDTTNDTLSIDLPELNFQPFYSHLYEQWIRKAQDNNLKQKEKQQYIDHIKSLSNNINNTDMDNNILEQQYFIISKD